MTTAWPRYPAECRTGAIARLCLGDVAQCNDSHELLAATEHGEATDLYVAYIRGDLLEIAE
jgi:hypothetical protein